MIEDQERCKRDILEQVRKLSPQTYTDAKNLVHFVSARATLRAGPAAEAPTDFAQLEKSLRTFVLEKRFQSKLAPAKTYLKNLLTDVEVIAKYNASVAEERKARAVRDLDDAEPSYAQMLDVKERILDDIDRTIDNTSSEVQQHTRRKLDDFLDNIEEHGRGTSWPGLLYAFTYATNVRSRLYRMAAGRVRQAELFRVEKSRDCIAHLEKAITECLPASDDPVQGMPKQVLEGGLTSGAEQSDAAGAFVPSEVSVELADFFDLSDRLELVREYIPSLTMIASGMYGYAKIADEVFKHGYQGLVNLGRFAFVSLAVAGL